jgi:aromatic-L-amino-acid/L-tryptophan decarboxylase
MSQSSGQAGTSVSLRALTQPFTSSPNWENYIEEFRRAAHDAANWIAEYLANTRDYPVVSRNSPGALVDALPRSGPERGESFEQILKDFRERVIPAVTHWNHPGFMAYFATTGSTPAVIGEMLAAGLNTVGLHWKTSPALVELEQVSLGWLREWMGLSDEWFGMIFDTASVGSMHALAAARELVAPEARENGTPAGLVMYTSEQSHSSIEKGAIAIGIGQKNVRKVPVDAEFRMRTDALAELVQRDLKAGLRPFCVVATVGTTSTTSVDPVPEIAGVSERHGMWLHVDSAYAGPAAMLPEFRWIFRGVERAQSLVVNPHKWLMTPSDLSAFYTRRPDILRRAFSLTPDYLKNQDDPRAVNLMDYGVPLGHRFRALKFWYVLRYFGREGLQQYLRSGIDLAQRLVSEIKKDSRFEISAPAPLSTVCLRLKGSDEENLAILERVNASGKYYISQSKLNGKTVLRVAIGNLGTTWEDVRGCWEIIRAQHA